MDKIKCTPDKFSSQNIFRASVNSRLDRIERMLKWLVVHKQSEFNDEIMILENLPDISDIIKEKK